MSLKLKIKIKMIMYVYAFVTTEYLRCVTFTDHFNKM